MSRERVRLENFADFKPGHFRKHEVEHDQGWRFLARAPQSGGAVRSRDDVKTTRASEGAGEHFDHVLLVFDDKNLLTRSRTHDLLRAVDLTAIGSASLPVWGPLFRSGRG